jgi:hypothetical protein
MTEIAVDSLFEKDVSRVDGPVMRGPEYDFFTAFLCILYLWIDSIGEVATNKSPI